jgi:hypothetical protein
MRNLIKRFLIYLKARDLFQAYWDGLDYISKDLETSLKREHPAIIKTRRGIVISRISKLIKVKNWKNIFESRCDGLNLFQRVDWVDRYLADIIKEIPFKLYVRSDYENPEKLAARGVVIDYSRLQQFHGTFQTQYMHNVNIFFEVFTSLTLSGIDPFAQKVVIFADGIQEGKVPDLNAFVNDSVYPAMKALPTAVFTQAVLAAFEPDRYLYRVFLEKK